MVTTYFSLLSPLRLLFLLSSVPLSWLIPSAGSAYHFFLRIISANHLGNESTGKDSKHGKLPASQTRPSWSRPQVPPGMSLSGSLMQPRSEAKAVTQTLLHGMPIPGALSQTHGFMIKDQENSVCNLFLLEAPNVWKRTESFEKSCGLRSCGTLDNPKPV